MPHEQIELGFEHGVESDLAHGLAAGFPHRRNRVKLSWRRFAVPGHQRGQRLREQPAIRLGGDVPGQTLDKQRRRVGGSDGLGGDGRQVAFVDAAQDGDEQMIVRLL